MLCAPVGLLVRTLCMGRFTLLRSGMPHGLPKWTQSVAAPKDSDLRKSATFTVSLAVCEHHFAPGAVPTLLPGCPTNFFHRDEGQKFERMRVSLAFQLFGGKVIDWLELYKTTIDECCGDITATVNFLRKCCTFVLMQGFYLVALSTVTGIYMAVNFLSVPFAESLTTS